MTPDPLKINHAVTGTDISLFMLRFNLSMDELSELISIPKSKLPAILASSTPVKDVAVALIVRAYSENPKLIPSFDIYEFFASLQGTPNQKLRHLSVIFGRDSSASYRWINKGRPLSDQPLTLGRLIPLLPGKEEGLLKLGIKEAKYRGVNPFKTGSWTKPSHFDDSEIAGRTYRKRATPGLQHTT